MFKYCFSTDDFSVKNAKCKISKRYELCRDVTNVNMDPWVTVQASNLRSNISNVQYNFVIMIHGISSQ